MNRRRKLFIIISLFMVLIAILGVSYAFMATKILGNSSSKNMSFISKKVRVTYKEISNSSSGETISPGYEYIKIFTATNTGNVEVNYHIFLDELENNFIRTQDITYTLYRKSGDNTIDADNLDDAEIISNDVFPTSNIFIKTDELLSKPGDVYTYALKVKYNTSTESQDSDSGHVFGFKVILKTEIENECLVPIKNIDYDISSGKIINTDTNKEIIKTDIEYLLNDATIGEEDYNSLIENYISDSNMTSLLEKYGVNAKDTNAYYINQDELKFKFKDVCNNNYTFKPVVMVNADNSIYYTTPTQWYANGTIYTPFFINNNVFMYIYETIDKSYSNYNYFPNYLIYVDVDNVVKETIDLVRRKSAPGQPKYEDTDVIMSTDLSKLYLGDLGEYKVYDVDISKTSNILTLNSTINATKFKQQVNNKATSFTHTGTLSTVHSSLMSQYVNYDNYQNICNNYCLNHPGTTLCSNSCYGSNNQYDHTKTYGAAPDIFSLNTSCPSNYKNLPGLAWELSSNVFAKNVCTNDGISKNVVLLKIKYNLDFIKE